MTARGSMLVLAGVGLVISVYLTSTHYADVAPVCTGLSDCLRVQRSVYAEWVGIPVALLGVAGYAGILAALLRDGEVRRLLAAFLALVGVGFSGYLTWAEAVRIEAFCQWCLVSAAIMVALAVLSALRVLRGEDGGPAGL
jgi:uncharacterized membrane protein